MIKKGYIVSLTYEVSDSEKYQAEKSLGFIKSVLNLLTNAMEHLSIIYNSFKDQTVDPKEIVAQRALLRQYRDKTIDLFNEFKIGAFHFYRSVNQFSSDYQISKMLKGFLSSIEDLEEDVNAYVEVYNELESKDFITNLIKSIDDIKKNEKNIEDIISSRLKKYITENVLAKSWIDDVGQKLNVEVKDKTPILQEIMNQK